MPTCWPTRSRKTSAGARRAFTIVESLVALVITGVGTLAVIGALRVASDATDCLREERRAAQLAESRLVRLMQHTSRPSGNRQGITGEFMWDETVQPGQAPGTMELVVTVRWHHQGRPRTLKLASITWQRQQGKP